MFFETGKFCEACNAEILVYPCSVKMGKVNARSLPGWKRCECQPYRFHEISSAEFDALVPGWRDRLAPDEDLEDVKNLVNELQNSVI